jgi:hypothetical protein
MRRKINVNPDSEESTCVFNPLRTLCSSCWFTVFQINRFGRNRTGEHELCRRMAAACGTIEARLVGLQHASNHQYSP